MFTLALVANYNGRNFLSRMSFQHSPEREFSLLSAKQAVDACNDMPALKERTKALVDAFGAMQTAVQDM